MHYAGARSGADRARRGIAVSSAIAMALCAPVPQAQDYRGDGGDAAAHQDQMVRTENLMLKAARTLGYVLHSTRCPRTFAGALP
jgi:hypothetical protein